MTRIASFRSIQLFVALGCLTMSSILLSQGRQSNVPLHAQVGTVSNEPFLDTIPGWASQSILSLYKQGIIRGYEDGRYGAADPVTRGQVTTLLYRILRYRNIFTVDPSDCRQTFDDVGASHYSFMSLCVLKLNDFARDSSHFDPDVSAPRAVTAAFIYRTLGTTLLQSLNETTADVLSKGQAFSDVSEGSLFAQDIAVMKETGIMTGYASGNFGPNDSLNRAEVATIMDRLLHWMETDHISSILPDPNQSSSVSAQNGQCPGVNLQTDLQNCGLCGHVCSFTNAQATCVQGGCSIASCDFGWTNANYNPDDGCEEKWDGISPLSSSSSSNASWSSSSSSSTSHSSSSSSNGPLPELAVAGIGINGRAGVYTVEAQVMNVGWATAVPSRVSASIDVNNNGVYEMTVPASVGTLLSGASANAQWTNVTVTASTIGIKICVDIDHSVTEVDETNNCTATTFPVTPVPGSSSSSTSSSSSSSSTSSSSSCTATSCGKTPPPPTSIANLLPYSFGLQATPEANAYNVIANVQNTGTRDAGSFTVTMTFKPDSFNGLLTVFSKSVPGIPAGGSTQLLWKNGTDASSDFHVLASTNVTLRICVDAQSAVSESSEADNCTQATIPVSMHSSSSSSSSSSSLGPKPLQLDFDLLNAVPLTSDNSSYVFNAQIVNHDFRSAGAFHVSFRLDGDSDGNFDVFQASPVAGLTPGGSALLKWSSYGSVLLKLGGGGSASTSFQWTPTPGSHRYKVCIDEYNEISSYYCEEGTLVVPASSSSLSSFSRSSLTPFSARSSSSITTFANLRVGGESLTATSVPGMWNISTMVSNLGRGSAGSFRIRLSLDKENDGIFDVTSTKTVTGLAAEASQEVRWTNGLSNSDFVWVSGPQTVHIRICADVDSTVAETNETDNCMDHTFVP